MKKKAEKLVAKIQKSLFNESFHDAIRCTLVCVEIMIDNAKENFKLAKELNHIQSEGLMAGELFNLYELKEEIKRL